MTANARPIFVASRYIFYMLCYAIHGSGERKIGFNGMCAGKKICQLLVHVISFPKWYGIKIVIVCFPVHLYILTFTKPK